MENTPLNKDTPPAKVSIIDMAPVFIGLFFGMLAGQFGLGFIPVILIAGATVFVAQKIFLYFRKK